MVDRLRSQSLSTNPAAIHAALIRRPGPIGAVGGAVGAATGAVGARLASMAPTRADRASSWPDSVSSLARVPGLAGVPVGLGSIPNHASMAAIIIPDLVLPWAWAWASIISTISADILVVIGNLAIIFLP
jgi:hypothetical protein